MKLTHLLGLMAFGSTVAYLVLKKRAKGNPGISGVEVKINPQQIVDGALAVSNIHPSAKDGIRAIARSAIEKYFDGQ